MDARYVELKNRKETPDLKRFGFGIEAFPAFQSAGGLMHTHDLIELVYVCRGEGIHLLGGKEVPAVPGSLAIVHHNQAHGFKTESGSLDLINIYLDINRFPLPLMPMGLQSILPLVIPFHPRFRHNLRDIITIQFKNPEKIRPLLSRMDEELREKKEGFYESLQHYFSIFLIEACRGYDAQKKSRSGGIMAGGAASNSAGRIERLCRHLDNHFSESLRLDDLARLSGLQKNYLCRAFKAHTGQTLLHYIIHQRLGQTLMLLRQTDRSILEIALESGFNDLPHFNRTFRREVGQTPREYRNPWR